ncbi:hypothetical protein N431DRAFT_482325 [Stipitochalara longipes BDJ]|nr:hypothetical protein N431DRAFT_482325 [Stipitochalara longipes BDJ]
MAASPSSVEEQIKQLDDARKLVLSDPTYYTPIIQGILPIVAPGARVELRRWAADFFAETFASPTIPASQKETLSLIVLETLKSLIENPAEDAAVVKSAVQTAASVYPLVFRYIINNPHDTLTWERMLAIKSRIFRIWDSAAPGVRICCIKFAQRVVLVQTKGPDADPRRGDPLEVSLSMVSPDHKLIPPKSLEAEASGLLDRMLAVFQENISDAVLVDATLNSLSILIRARPHIANKILNVVLNFNPLKQANSPMTPKLRVMVKSMEKTTRSLLMHILKRDPQHPLGPRIQQYVERMMRSRSDIFDEASRKRGPPEPTDGLDPAKRQKLGTQVANAAPKFYVPPLTPGPHTIAELFTVTGDEALKAFDVAMLSEDLVVKIGITILQRIDAETLNQAVDGIRQRYKSLGASQPELLNPETAPLGVDEDDDDYEPDFSTAETEEQILNKLDLISPNVEKATAPDMALGHFTLPQPPPLTTLQATEVGQGTVSRVFGVMQTLEEKMKKTKGGINRLAASSFDRDAWITILTRLATRTFTGLDNTEEEIKADPSESEQQSLANMIRESLYLYILEDFRKRIDIAIAWLCEEWYNDKVQVKVNESAVLHYEKWVLKIMDGMIPYLDASDRNVLVRFVSEIPGLSSGVLERLKGLCRDPATVTIALTSLLFLTMQKPPAKKMVLGVVEEIWDTYEDARPFTLKLFAKYIPGLGDRGKIEEEKQSNGMEAIAA